MRVRPACVGDAEAVNDLLAQLGYRQEDRAVTAARIRAWVEDPVSAAYIAEIDGVPLGVIAVHLCPFFERQGAWARIVALVVAEGARDTGVGSRLVEAAESFAASHQCVRMEVTSSDQRPGAHGFYERRGYTNQAGRSSRFLRELAPAAG